MINLKVKHKCQLAIVVYFIALIFRLFFSLYVHNENSLNGDSAEYYSMAQNVANGLGLLRCSPKGECEPMIHRMPLYIYFLAAHIKVCEDDLIPIKISQSLLDSLLPVFVFLLGIELGLSLYWATIAGIIAAIHPGLFIIPAYIMTEGIYNVLVVMFLFLSVRAVKYKTPLLWLQSGIILMLVCMTRPNGIPFVPIATLGGIYVLRKFLSPKQLALNIFLLIVPSLIFVSAWSIRNWEYYHKFIPMVIGGGFEYNFYLATFDKRFATQEDLKYRKKITEEYFSTYGLKRDAVGKQLIKQGIKNILKHPVKFIIFSILRTENVLAAPAYPGIPYLAQLKKNKQYALLLAKLCLRAIYFLIAISGLIGMWKARHNWRNWITVGLWIGFNLILYASTQVNSRHGSSVFPALIPFACISMSELLQSKVKNQ